MSERERERVARLLYEAWERWETDPALRGQRLCEAQADAILADRRERDVTAVEHMEARVEAAESERDSARRARDEMLSNRRWIGVEPAEGAIVMMSEEQYGRAEAREAALREALLGILRLSEYRPDRIGTHYQDIWTLAVQTLNPEWREQLDRGIGLLAQAQALLAPPRDAGA